MIKIARSRCTECQICMTICSLTHFDLHTTKGSRIHVEGVWPDAPAINVCLLCKSHECVQACPHGALTLNQWIELARDRCDSCGACVDACPVKGIRLDPQTGFPLICDTCRGAFQCVQWCPTQALTKKE